MFFFYQIFILVTTSLLYLLSPFSSSLRKFLDNRAQGLRKLREIMAADSSPTLWLHAASVGEAQQASALAQTVKKKQRNMQIILSVYSNSVTIPESTSNTKKKADGKSPHTLPFAAENFHSVFYLPVDLPWQWQKLLAHKKIKYFVAMTWDLWPNLLRTLKKNHVKTYLCSAAFDPQSFKNSGLGGWAVHLFRFQYRDLEGIATVSQEDQRMAQRLARPTTKIKTIGDVRYQAIKNRKKSARQANLLTPFQRLKNVIFFASTYRADEDIFIPLINPLFEKFTHLNICIFPHHIEKKRIREIADTLQPEKIIANLFTEDSLLIKKDTNHRVIIVDQLGLLAFAYQYCLLSYVGGGFHHRIHNTAEAAIHGKMTLSGPRISASPIARELKKKKYLMVCHNRQELFEQVCSLLEQRKTMTSAAASIKEVITQQQQSASLFCKHFLGI